jgi:hypothetical protein
MPIFKRALDLSFLKDLPDDKSGLDGIYYHRFPKNKIEILKKQLGQIDPTIGIKVYRAGGGLSKIGELLSLHFIAPEINKLGIKAPYTAQPLSITNFIHHGYIMPRHFEGSHLGDWNFPFDLIRYITCTNLTSKLKKAGIYWDDCHAFNILFPNKILNDLQKNWDEIKKNYRSLEEAKREWDETINPDLSDHAIIVDLGYMRCYRGSDAGQKIEEFENKLFDYMNSKKMDRNFQLELRKVFNNILI